jgi:PAS domain S-box-containing protein
MKSNLTSDAPFRAAFESARDSIVFVDREGLITFWNPAAAALFGYSAGEVIGLSLERLMPPRFRDAHRVGLMQAVATRDLSSTTDGMVLAGLRKDGSEFPLELSMALGESDGELFCVGIIRDITERKQLEQMQAVQLSVTQVLAGSRSLSESFEQILGAMCDALQWEIGNLWLASGTPPVLARASTWYGGRWGESAFATLNDTLTFARGEGLPGRVWASGQPSGVDDLHDGAGLLPLRAAAAAGLHGACGFPIVIDRDVVGVVEFFSREKRAVDWGLLTVMGALGSQIGQFIERRRAEEAREHMRAKLILSDRMSSVGTLAAGIAHEINNPLGYVIANVDMIMADLRAPTMSREDLQAMAADVRAGAERIRKIVRGMKAFSRADEERRVVVDVTAVLDQASHMTAAEVRHRARLVKSYGPVPRVHADEVRLGQVFVNLLINAAQATDDRGADANEIRVVTRTDAAGRAVIEVRDTGCGIAEEARARIFDPFFTTKPVGVGTGLGLSICHGIVTDLGGEIEVESKVGVGSVFRVLLPPAAVDARPAAALAPAPGGGTARRGRVLIVDDDLMLGKAMRRVLSAHDVTVLTNAEDALQRIASREAFDLILCDLMMPEMTGMDLHAKLLDVAPDTVARMVFVTGGAFTPRARAFLDEVPNERLEKPLDTRNLQAFVARYVR